MLEMVVGKQRLELQSGRYQHDTNEAMGPALVDWKGTSAIIMKSSSSVHVFTVISFLLLNGSCALDLKDCMKTCINQKGFPIPSQCPNNKACDWLCEAYYKNCSGNTKYHCAKINGTGKYTRECALPVTCTQGTEPVITMASGSPVVSCLPCPDKMYYNSATNLSSDNFSNCQEKKHNQCTAEFKKKDCGQERGQKRWDEQSISDGFCRCDARNGYAPFDDSSLFKEEYCFTRAENCRKVYCDVGMELSLNYVCIPKCPDGLNRTELSDECKNLTGWTTTSPIPNITATRPSTEPATASPPKPITTSNKTDTLPDNNSSQKTDIGIISGIVVVVVVFIVTTGVVCYCCKERLDQLRCQLCQLCGTARSQGTKAEYFQVPTDPSGTIGNHKIDCSINIVTEGTKNGEANGTTNHVGDSQNTVDLVNEHPNNENDNNSAGDDQTEATGSTERKGRKKKGSRHKEENNKPIINNYNIKVKIEGNQNNYHIGSASQVEGLDLNLIEETADAEKLINYFDKYLIDVAGLPAYTYSRTSIQNIERICTKHLTKTRFSERDTEVFMAKDAHLFTTVKQSSIVKFATSMNCRLEMKDIENTIRCTYAPCVFVIEYKQLHAIAHIFEELQEKGLVFCVLIIGDKSCIDDMQTFHKLLVAYASESDMQDAVDDLLERFAFSVLRKLLEQIATEADVGPDERKTGAFNETLKDIYQHIRVAYNNSGVPGDERPLIPKDNLDYPSNIDEIIAQVLQVQGVFACFKNNGRLKIYIDNTAVKSESECTNEVINRIAAYGFDKYSVFVGSLERYWQAGDAISNPKIEATLGGFANKYNGLSPPINPFPQENQHVHEEEPKLVALISRHVATHLQSGDLKVSDKILGHIGYIHDWDWLDIVPVDVAKELQNDCETRFRTEDDILKHAELNGFTLENRSPVHIWGAKSAPGLGFLSECDPSESNKYIFVASRSDENIFCVPGDSGSFVCSSDRKGRLFALAILIGKFKPSKIIKQAQQNENYANKYDDLSAEEQIQESNKHAQNKHEETFCVGDETAHGTDNRTLTTETECQQLEPTFVALNLVNAFKGLSENYNCEFTLCREKKQLTA